MGLRIGRAIKGGSRPTNHRIRHPRSLASQALAVQKVVFLALAYWTVAGINIRFGREKKRGTTWHQIKLGMLPADETTVVPRVDIGITELPELDIDIKDLELEIGITELPELDIDIKDLELEIGINELPKLELGITELPKINVALDPLELKLTEIPSIRVHLPVNFRFGFCLLGREIAGVRICGEAQIITEPYVPNPCEKCHEGP